MPLLKRFAFLGETVRNHPVIASTGAATGGVLLGAFVAVQLLATPKPGSDPGIALAAVETKAAPKPIAEIKPAPKPTAETTGSAPTSEKVASADCDQQTWPHLSRICMEEFRAKNRSARVVTTDRLDKPTIAAIETQPSTPAAPAPPIPPSSAQPAAPATVAVATPPAATVAVAPPPGALATPPGATEAPKPTPAPAPAVASAPPPASTPLPAVAPTAAPRPVVVAPAKVQPAMAPPEPAFAIESKEKRIAKQSKRKWKGEHKSPAEQDVDDDGGTFASADPDERAFEDRGSRSRGERRSRREIVERWIERDYDVPDSRGGRRQVTVIRRNNGGGLFESLFGN